MRILVLAHRVPFPPNKGEKLRTYHQLIHLINIGHTIEVLCTYDNSQDKAYIFDLERKLGVKASGISLNNRYAHYLLGLLKNLPLSVANFYRQSFQPTVDETLSNFKPDAILLTASSMSEYLFNSSTLEIRSLKPRTLVDFMDLDSDKWLQYAEQAKLPMRWIYQREAKLLEAYELRSAQTFDECLFVAESERELFISRHPMVGSIRSVGNGIDTNAFYPVQKERQQTESPVFLFTGVMDYSPNIDAVLWFTQHVWPSLLEKRPHAKFIVAGMNPSAAIKQLNGVDNIEVTGFVEDILPYFHQADVFVAPFRLARGVQNKILQAMACALPVVTTEKGLEGIDAINGEHLLTANEPNDFVEAITTLMDDSLIYKKISINAETLIKENYSWDAVLKSFPEICFGSEQKIQ